MKIKLDYDRLKAYAESKGIHKLSELCRQANVNYYAVLNNRYNDSGISIELAWKISDFFECDIKDICKVSGE